MVDIHGHHSANQARNLRAGLPWLSGKESRIHLPVQETQVPSLILEDPACHGPTKPMCHNY